MTSQRPQEVRRLSTRVALRATALVGVVYLVAAVAVVAVVTADLTRQVDDRLAESLDRMAGEPPRGDEPYRPPPGGRPFGPVLLSWLVAPDGTVYEFEESPELPAEYLTADEPETVTVDGTELRIAGRSIDDAYVVVGQSLDQVSQARSTVILAELLIAPVLLAAVFFGAVAIGRRVAMPIELARRRQLELTADASHELRTPLAVIEAHTSLALNQERSAEWYRGTFERVDRESKRMHRLLDDLLWLARFDATEAPPHAEPVDLGLLAAQAADRFGVVAEARHLRLEVRGAEAGAVITAPPEWLDRLLGVLLDNACKYSPDNGAVTVAVAIEGGRVRLTVDDSGPGIPEDQRERIFDRFHRASEGAEGSGGSGASAGAGLGLAIADAIVRATGGRWQVGRSPDGGARMSVSWASAFGGHPEPAPVASPTRIPTGE